MPFRVLVVEDDDHVRAMLRLALESEGYGVTEAASAEDALLVFSEADPDLMLVDLMLGGMSGIDAIRTIRRRSDIPIVIVSARTDTSDIVTGLEAGADDYVSKPFQIEEISARLRALLRRSRGTGEGAGDAQGQSGSSADDAVEEVVLDAGAARGALVLEPAAGRLLQGGEPIHLTLTEFRMLCRARGGARPSPVAGAAPREGVGARVLRRRATRGRPRPSPAYQDRGRRGRARAADHGSGPRVPARSQMRQFRPRSLRGRTILYFGLGSLLVAGVFAASTYLLARNYLLQQRTDALERRGAVDARVAATRLSTSGTEVRDILDGLDPLAASAVLIKKDGEWYSSSLDVGEEAIPPSLVTFVSAGQPALQVVNASSGPVAVVGIPMPTVGAEFYEVAPLTELAGSLSNLAVVLVLGTLIATGAAVGIALWSSRRLLEPLDELAGAAAEIAGGELSRRLDVTDDPDLATLVGSFNSMVDALQGRIERDARFASDVSHELRTPLTTLLGSVQLLAASRAGPARTAAGGPRHHGGRARSFPPAPGRPHRARQVRRERR